MGYFRLATDRVCCFGWFCRNTPLAHTSSGAVIWWICDTSEWSADVHTFDKFTRAPANATWLDNFFLPNSILGLTCLECPTQFVSSCQGSRFLSTGPLQDIWKGPTWPIQLTWEKLFHLWFRIHVLQSRYVWRHQWAPEPLELVAFLEVNGEPFKRNSPFF